MKIIHFCESLARGGGIASFVANLTHEQSKTNNVTVCSIFHSNGEVDLNTNVTTYNLGKTEAGFSVKYPLRVLRFLSKNHYDIVHIHSAFLYYALAVVFLHRRSKFVYTIHTDARRENSNQWDRLFLWLKRWCFKHHWMHPVTISQVSKESFDDLYGMESHLIYNGIRKRVPTPNIVNLSQYKVTSKTRVFIHPGRISEAKNQVVLCRAFKKVIDDGHDVVLLIAGTVQDKQIFDQINNFLCNRIIYIGQRSDVLELLSEADAMCLSSIWEGLPITLLEAMSVGCIPICTPVGGIVDVLKDNHNGVLASSTDETDYYLALCRFLELGSQQIEDIKSACLEEFEEYNITKTSALYIDYYKRIACD